MKTLLPAFALVLTFAFSFSCHSPSHPADNSDSTTTVAGVIQPTASPGDVILSESFDRDLGSTPFQFWGGGRALSNVADSNAVDQKALTLILPQGSDPSPGNGPNVLVRDQRYQFGDFEARLRTAACTTQTEGVVSGFFTYFNDGSDSNRNGIADNSEIDFEWLCAEPESIYLTLWTDYDDARAVMRRVSRKINLARGIVEYTRYGEGWGDADSLDLQGIEAVPTTIAAIPGYDSSRQYYEYGFSWRANGVVWWIVHPVTQQKIILWDYKGPVGRVTQVPAKFMFNLWHSDNWNPEKKPNALGRPATDLKLQVDWVRIKK